MMGQRSGVTVPLETRDDAALSPKVFFTFSNARFGSAKVLFQDSPVHGTTRFGAKAAAPGFDCLGREPRP